jgi:hypothetical protein
MGMLKKLLVHSAVPNSFFFRVKSTLRAVGFSHVSLGNHEAVRSKLNVPLAFLLKHGIEHNGVENTDVR